MKVLLVAGTCLKFGAANVVLLADSEVEFPTVLNAQQMAETLFTAHPSKLDENLGKLTHTIEEIRETVNPYDMEGGVKKEIVTSRVTFGANGVANVEELHAEPAPADIADRGTTLGRSGRSKLRTK